MEGVGGAAGNWGMARNTARVNWHKFCGLASWHHVGEPKGKLVFSSPKLRLPSAVTSLSAKGLGVRSIKVTSA